MNGAAPSPGSNTLNPEPLELHWMKAMDATMTEEHGLPAPTLCGAWMEPDELFDTKDAPIGRSAYDVISCAVCDALHVLHTPQ